MTLSRAAVGEPFIIQHADSNPQVCRRLGELGVRPGQRVELLQRTAFGALVLGVGGMRIALDRATARSITVTSVPSAQAASL